MEINYGSLSHVGMFIDAKVLYLNQKMKFMLLNIKMHCRYTIITAYIDHHKDFDISQYLKPKEHSSHICI